MKSSLPLHVSHVVFNRNTSVLDEGRRSVKREARYSSSMQSLRARSYVVTASHLANFCRLNSSLLGRFNPRGRSLSRRLDRRLMTQNAPLSSLRRRPRTGRLLRRALFRYRRRSAKLSLTARFDRRYLTSSHYDSLSPVFSAVAKSAVLPTNTKPQVNTVSFSPTSVNAYLVSRGYRPLSFSKVQNGAI